MSKPVKGMITEEYARRYEGYASACVVEFTGMNVQMQEQLRGKLREKSARLQLVKNSLAARALKGGPLEPLADSFEGPCALVTCEESIIDVAKTLVAAAKEFEPLKLKHAIFDGDPDLMSIPDLSKMKGKTELLGEIAMLVSSPGRAIAGCLSSPQAKIAGCLKAIVDKEAEAA